MNGRVLIVDDDLALAEMLGIVLRNEGLEVSHVADGAGALGAFRDSRPDLVLLDVMLPGLDGMEVCRRIRAESGVPIVMLTARTDTVHLMSGGEVVDDAVPDLEAARARHTRSRAELPAAARQLQRGEPAIPTVYPDAEATT